MYGVVPLADGRLLLATDALGFRALTAFAPETATHSLLGARGARYPDVSVRGDIVFELASYDANLWLHGTGQAEGERLTASNRYDAYPRLSPDGRQLAFQSNRDGLEAIYLLDLDTRVETRLPLSGEDRWAHPSWSPDGHALVLTRYASAVTEIWRYRIGSALAEHLPQVPLGAHDPQFDLDGVHLWYLIETPQRTALRRVSLEHVDDLYERPESVYHFSIDPQGLYFLENDRPALVHCATPDAPTCKAFAFEMVTDQRRNWAVADDAIYFVGLDAEQKEEGLQRYTPSTGALEKLSWPVPSTLSRALAVSRDGTRAIIASTDKLDIDLMWVKR
jgi:hypothetical protein